MPAGNLFNAIQAFQQSSDWMAKQRQQQQMQHALRALGQMYGQPQPDAGPMNGSVDSKTGAMSIAGTGMTPDQSAGAAQNAQSAAQAVGWPQQAGPGGPVAPNAVPYSPGGSAPIAPHVLEGLKTLMQQGGPQAPQGPQLAQPGTPSMAQPGTPMKQPPVPGMSSTAQPDAAGMDDPFKAATQSIQTIAQGIKAANPNIDPMTLAMAVQSQIENIKGVAPLTKASMSAQLGAMKLQIQAQDMAAKVQHWNDWYVIARRNATTREEIAAVDEKYKNGMLELGQARIDASIANNERTNATRVTTAQIGASARQYAADKGYARGIDTANINQSGANARAGVGAEGKRGAAITGAYTKAYGAFMANSPGATPEQAQAAAEAAADAVAAMTPATPAPTANVPSGNPLAGQGKPAGRPVLTARPAPNKGPARPQTKADLDKLPKGAAYVNPADGRVLHKNY